MEITINNFRTFQARYIEYKRVVSTCWYIGKVRYLCFALNAPANFLEGESGMKRREAFFHSYLSMVAKLGKGSVCEVNFLV